jgi:SsrA-binding protein
MSKLVAENRKARFDYEVLETFECGIVLVGSELKPLRAGKANLQDSFVRYRENELFLMNAFITKYENARHFDHDETRIRKLLLHKEEIEKVRKMLEEKHLTSVPLKLYFNNKNICKVLIGVCRGKKNYDKRQTLKEKDQQREMKRLEKY